MKTLVTGGLGVNGAWVTRKLLDRGHEVVVADLLADRSLLGERARDVEVLAVDVTNGEAMKSLLEEHRIEAVVHMAALISGLQENPLAGFRVNALGTVQLLDAALRAGVRRFVYTSSRAVYGDIDGAHAYPRYDPVREDFRLGARNVYDVTKLSGELMGRNFARLGLEFAALRFATIFGPGKLTRHGPMAIYSRFIENAMAGVPLHIPKGGDERDDVIYVDDIAEACVLAATREKLGFDAYHISRGIGTTLGEFADAVKRVYPAAELTVGPGLDYFNAGVKYAGVLDNARARQDLGFVPRFDLEQGIRDYVTRLEDFGLPPTVT